MLMGRRAQLRQVPPLQEAVPLPLLHEQAWPSPALLPMQAAAVLWRLRQVQGSQVWPPQQWLARLFGMRTPRRASHVATESPRSPPPLAAVVDRYRLAQHRWTVEGPPARAGWY